MHRPRPDGDPAGFGAATPPNQRPAWRALAREAALAAEHIAFGATALGKANYAQEAYYAQAFFALSVGLERSAKLAIVVDHALANNGAYPAPNTLRNAGHGLVALLGTVDQIAERQQLDPDDRMPRTEIHHAILATLSDFATNVTRYFNLDLVTQAPRIVGHDDPIATWSQSVTEKVVAMHYRVSTRQRHEAQALHIGQLLGDFALVRFHSETGDPVTGVYEGSRRTALAEFARRWERMYVLQFGRFLGKVLSDLGYRAHLANLEDIPYLAEFFAIFNNNDAFLRRRKTWSIYP